MSVLNGQRFRVPIITRLYCAVTKVGRVTGDFCCCTQTLQSTNASHLLVSLTYLSDTPIANLAFVPSHHNILFYSLNTLPIKHIKDAV